MPGIPHQTSDKPTPSEIAGERTREYRRVTNISQDVLAQRMQDLGHTTWRRQTVGQIETGHRNITIDELISLADALEISYQQLLNPTSLSEPASDDRFLDFLISGGSPWARERLLAD